MNVKVRPHRRGGWDVDVRLLLATGKRYREGRKLSASYSKTNARGWGERCERELLRDDSSVRQKKAPAPEPSEPASEQREVPTLREFAPRFIDNYARANRQKPSGVAAKETILSTHLITALGDRKLDAIGNEDAQELKRRLERKAPKTVNNTLSTLSVLLKSAVDWKVIDRVPCTIRLLKTPRASAAYHHFESFARLVDAAQRLDARAGADRPARPAFRRGDSLETVGNRG